MPKLSSAVELTALREELSACRSEKQATVIVCGGTGCQASGCQAVKAAFGEELERQGLSDKVTLRVTGCHGFCEQGPLAVIEPSNTFYRHLKAEDVAEIVSETVVGGKPIERLLYEDPATNERIERESEIPFYASQDRVVLNQNREIDPQSIDDYIAGGGYQSLVKVLQERSPEEVIGEVKSSGLRGRGGGGFPTGRKWETCRAAGNGDGRYVICNADEGDPGAYMDRSILEGNPHTVLEGMLIGAYAIGSSEGYIYVRNEYPLALAHARKAVEQAREYGLLGKNILGTDFSFDIEIARGAGAFVCGESTALMASLEGKVGEPRAKDVHTVEEGLNSRPTTLNNVETWANIPVIIENGPEWFAAKGTPESTGTKVFALTGQIQNTGLVEVPMGTSLRTIVFDIGGGGHDGGDVKAVQTGGPSGGCLPVSKFNLPVEFDTLAKAGSMVGSGGMVVMDEHTCMVDVAKYFLNFLQEESCGKCVPCRIGVDRMLEIVTDITEGRGRPEQIPLLEELMETVAEGSLCGLGKTAPNPVRSTLKYFRSEYMAHIEEGRCPAGVCRELIRYSIDQEKCNGCGACLKACPHDAVTGEKKQPHSINQEVCTKCGICSDTCKFDAVSVN
jgi:NADH:ubiquinone oxidoreductase subunit F (NADH-binding)/(2Fe-2S) ferredoxin/NAD-dependent dihydropyrimidine dehydrogenase PreA subunit